MNKVRELLASYAEADLERTAEAMPVLARLLSGRPMTEELWSEQKRAERTHEWRRVLPRSLVPGDVVRVRPDAYDSEDARAVHNGKVGRVAALRGGVVVAYDGEQGATMGFRHMPEKLERQVPLRAAKTATATTTRGVTQ